jgi:hypothetical protein
MRRVLPLLVAVVLLGVGFLLAYTNSDAISSEKKYRYGVLCKRGQRTRATVRNGTVGSAMVTYTYDYEVNGTKYTQEVTTDRLPDRGEFEVTYWPSDPRVAERGDVCETYERIKSNRSSETLMWFGIGMCIVGLGVGWSGIMSLLRSWVRQALEH